MTRGVGPVDGGPGLASRPAMIRRRLRLSLAVLLALAGASACATDDAPDDRFPCGDGTCALGTELCLIGPDRCVTCVAVPAACSADASCACLPPANDDSLGATTCVDSGTCEDVEGGAVITCEEVDDWGCG